MPSVLYMEHVGHDFHEMATAMKQPMVVMWTQPLNLPSLWVTMTGYEDCIRTIYKSVHKV